MVLVILVLALVALFIRLLFFYSYLVDVKEAGTEVQVSHSYLMGVARMSLLLVIVIILCLILIQ